VKQEAAKIAHYTDGLKAHAGKNKFAINTFLPEK
jgi:hypothetical protein